MRPSLVQAFHSWRGAVADSAVQQAALRKAARRIKARTLSAAFRTWEANTGEAQLMRRREVVAQAHRERWLARGTLQAWQGLVLGKQRHQSKALMTSIMQRMQQRDLLAAFQGWRENSQALARERRLLVRATARFQRRLLSGAFACFREACDRQRNAKRLVARCLGRARNRLMAQVLRRNCWITCARCIRVAGREQLCLDSSVSCCLRLSFCRPLKLSGTHVRKVRSGRGCSV